MHANDTNNDLHRTLSLASFRIVYKTQGIDCDELHEYENKSVEERTYMRRTRRAMMA